MFVSCGLYGLVWFHALRTDYVASLTREPPDATEKSLLVFCTCTLAAFPFLSRMHEHVLQVQGRRASASLLWFALVPLVGFGVALYRMQRALTELEQYAQERHGHGLLRGAELPSEASEK
jgi:membrane protein required for beta-lactamase induction